MQNTVIGVILNTFFAVGLAAGMPSALTSSQLFDICASSTLSEAAPKGDQLGWPRMSDAQLEDWRSKFIHHNGGSVQVLGWRRGQRDGDDSLSFWIAEGPNGHRACSYSTGDPGGLLDALSERFGTPTSLDKHDFGTTAYWKRGAIQASFSQVGSSAVVNISYHHNSN
jgi:hypothetical protein